jgi:hypothetical protein
VPLLHIDWTQVHLASDADALELWKQIAPTGADWELRLGEVPSDQDLQKRLALAVLREGNFACHPTSNCVNDASLEAEPGATLSDPCLRRELALWALDRLDDSDASQIEHELVALAGLPPPEEELVREAFGLVPVGRDDLLLSMMTAARSAGQGEVADESLQWLSEAALHEVAARLHSNGALHLLDPATARAAFLAAISDAQLSVSTSVAAINDLVALESHALPKDLRAALIHAVKDPRCEVAAAAARALASAGDHRFEPRPANRSVAAALRALCVMAAFSQDVVGADPALRTFVSRVGLQVFDHATITDEPDNPAGEFIAPAELVALPFLEELGGALEHCTGTTCRGDGLRFELTLDPDRTLRRIERFAEPTACP